MSFWDKRKNDVYGEFAANKESFLQKPSVRRTMHNKNINTCSKLLDILKEDARLRKVKDPNVGSPNIYKQGLSQPTLRSLYYYTVIEKMLSKNIRHVTDFGAGYGANCRVWHQLGFSGEYYLVDLPEINEIQKYYTSRTVQGNLHFMQAGPEMIPTKSPSLFFATFSFNETPLAVRKMVEPLLYNYDYIFIHYNHSFPTEDGQILNNIKYFKDLQSSMSNEYVFIKQEDQIQNKNFMIGKRK